MWSNNSIPGYIVKQNENTNLKRQVYSNVHNSTITIAKTWKQPKCPSTDDWLRCGEGNGNLLKYSCLGNPMDRGAWWATVYTVAKSGIWLTHHHIYMSISIYINFIYLYIYKTSHIYIKWNTAHPLKRMKFCHLQQSGWTWRILYLVN